PARGDRIDRAHRDHDVSGPRGADDAPLSRDDRLGLDGGLDHANVPPDARPSLGRRAHHGGAPRAPQLGLGRIDIVHHQREAVFDEVLRHRAAHSAEADEADWAEKTWSPRWW